MKDDNAIMERKAEPAGSMVQVSQSREMEEVRGAIFLARQFPRDMASIEKKILEECSQTYLAERAMYAYPRGTELVTGPSIRLAEAIMRVYGNASASVREIRQEKGESIMQAVAWDYETNVRSEKTFSVPHKRATKKGIYALTDPRDIYEITANMGARRLRACIIGILPGALISKCITRCEETLKEGSGDPLPVRIKKMLAAFAELGVTKDQMEKRLGHNSDACTDVELVTMAKMYRAIRDGFANPAQFFDGFVSDTTSEDLNEKFGQDGDGK